MQTYNSSYFLGKNYFGNNGFYNMFTYQLSLNTIELKEGNGPDYVIGWKSKGVYTSNFHNIDLE